MRITPLDIRKQEFRKAMRGLDAEEVYAFLSTVGDEYEAVLNDNKALRERLIELDDKVQEYRTMEKTLRDTLLTAERVTVEAKDNARREAHLIIKEAQIEADKSLRDIKSQAMKLRQEVSQLRGQRESYLGRMKVIAESLLKFIETVEQDFWNEDDAYKEQLPKEEASERAAAPMVPPAEPAGLFDDERDAGEEPGATQAALERPDSRATASKEPGVAAPDTDDRRRTGRGIPSDLRQPDVPDSEYPRPPSPHPVEETQRRGPDEARNESRARAPMADINSIIERMAEGQKEFLNQSSGLSSGRSAPQQSGRSSRTERFDPVSAKPAGPIASGEAADEPPQTLEATTDDPTPARGVPRVRLAAEPSIRAGSAWERMTEATTAVEADGEDNNTSSRTRTSDKVTSEISLEQIRRDLERRVSKDKDDT
jgi:cell division initiation protein